MLMPVSICCDGAADIADVNSAVFAVTWTYFLTHHMALFRRFLRVKRYLDALATATERAGLQRVIDVVWLRDLQIA